MEILPEKQFHQKVILFSGFSNKLTRQKSILRSDATWWRDGCDTGRHQVEAKKSLDTNDVGVDDDRHSIPVHHSQWRLCYRYSRRWIRFGFYFHFRFFSRRRNADEDRRSHWRT